MMPRLRQSARPLCFLIPKGSRGVATGAAQAAAAERNPWKRNEKDSSVPKGRRNPEQPVRLTRPFGTEKDDANLLSTGFVRNGLHPWLQPATPPGSNTSPHRRIAASPPAFTIVELLVAVALLIVVFVIVGTILSQLRNTVGLAAAQNEIATEAAAIEKRLRQDFARITRDGFMVIRNIEVPTTDPVTGDPITVRSDDLLFFATGPWTSARLDSNDTQTFQAPVARLTIGHAAYDSAGNVPSNWPNTPYVPAIEWRLTRHQLLLTPEATSGPLVGAPQSIWHRNPALGGVTIHGGLWDVGQTSDLMTIRRQTLTNSPPPGWLPPPQGVAWPIGVKGRMEAACYRIYGTSSIKRDSSLNLYEEYLRSNTLLAARCSQIVIDFAGDYTGDGIIDRDGDSNIIWYGGLPNPAPHTWPPDPEVNLTLPTGAPTRYCAVFGYDDAVTPWPELVRVTIDLHDRNLTLHEKYLDDATHTAEEDQLQGARRFSFVFHVPR